MRFLPLRTWLVGFGLAVCISACDTRITTDIQVEHNGSGSVFVTLFVDHEAAKVIYDLDDGLAASIGDLQQAGWEVSPVSATESGQKITARKRFGNPEQLSEIVVEVAGLNGVVRNVELSRQQQFARVGFLLNAEVAQSADIELFSDSSFSELVGGSLSQLAKTNEVSSDDVDVRLRVKLPGSMSTDQDYQVDSQGYMVVPINPFSVGSSQTEAEPTDVSIQATSFSAKALLLRSLAVIAGLLGVLLIMSFLLGKVRARTMRPPRTRWTHGGASRSTLRKPTIDGPAASGGPADRSSGVAGEISRTPGSSNKASSTEVQIDTQPAQQQGGRDYDVIVFDGMGVIYSNPDNLVSLFLPFVRGQGCSATDDEVLAKATEVTQGRLTTKSLWDSLGIEGETQTLNDYYLATLTLTPGIVNHLRGLRNQGVVIGCLTNDSAEWSRILRDRHSLSSLIDFWVVSGEIGARKPSVAAFETVRKKAQVDVGRILLVDDEMDVLDQARQFGFGTALYHPAKLDAVTSESGGLSEATALSDGESGSGEAPHRFFRGFDAPKNNPSE